jgi:hypothetical protein
MPLEIRELHIKVAIDESAGQNQPSSGGGNNAAQQEALIREIVDKILEILKERAER